MASRGGTQYRKNKKTILGANIQKYGKITCECCKKAPLVQNLPGEKNNHKYSATIDHIIPLSKGGTHALTNLKVLCFECNFAKGGEVA